MGQVSLSHNHLIRISSHSRWPEVLLPQFSVVIHLVPSPRFPEIIVSFSCTRAASSAIRCVRGSLLGSGVRQQRGLVLVERSQRAIEEGAADPGLVQRRREEERHRVARKRHVDLDLFQVLENVPESIDRR